MNLAVLAGLVAAYVCGSFPSAYLAGRVLKGVDLRTVGSGNLGATNVYRELGTWPAVVVLAVDVIKGAIPVLFVPGAMAAWAGVGTAAPAWWGLAVGGAAIAGHARPVFLLGAGGGKGVATAAGVFFALTPLAAGLAFVVFIGTVAGTRFVSAGSLAAATALPVLQLGTGASASVVSTSVAFTAFVFWAHRSNIGRMRAGTEPRIGRRKVAST